MDMNTIVLTGGGTAGHVTPALALVPYLRTWFGRILYAGQAGGIEESLSTHAGLSFHGTEAIRFDRRRPWRNLAIPAVLHRASAEAALWMREMGTDIVFSKGGYCALPSVLAAHRLGLPIVCHESDRTIGLANRLSLHYTSHFITSFDVTPRGVCLGNPIRDAILRGNPAHVPIPLDARPVLLVMGGSMGALFLNQAAAAIASRLPQWQVINIYGRTPVETSANNYFGLPFTDTIEDYFARADVVLCRAGANTLFELAALGKRVVAVPLPRGTSRGDQVQNAAYFAMRYGFDVIEQSEATAERLASAVTSAFDRPLPHTVAAGNAAARIARYIYDVLRRARDDK